MQHADKHFETSQNGKSDEQIQSEEANHIFLILNPHIESLKPLFEW